MIGKEFIEFFLGPELRFKGTEEIVIKMVRMENIVLCGYVWGILKKRNDDKKKH